MAVYRTRSSDSTFDLNLAPVLDIIVAIVPMLLLSVAFVQVKMIETPTAQVVQQQEQQAPPKPETSITLKVSKTKGFSFHVVNEKGQASDLNVQISGGAFDYDGLYKAALKLKEQHPSVNKLQLDPEANIAFDELVQVMDQVRQKQEVKKEKVSISDATTAKQAHNDYLFPEVIFSSVGG